MNILLMHPVSKPVAERFVTACTRNGWKPTIMTIEDSAVGEGLDLHDWIRVPALIDDAAYLEQSLGGRHFDAVVPAVEFAVKASEFLAERLGLPCNPLASIDATRNKAAMRRAFAAVGLPQPRIIASFNNLAQARSLDWSVMTFPLIMKPVDMAASWFVRLCHNPADVLENFVNMLDFRKSRLTNYAFEMTALLEEFADGPEYSLECVVQNGRLAKYFLTKKFVSPFPDCDEIAHLTGDEVPDHQRDAVRDMAERIIAAWAVRAGVMHVEFKMSDRGIFVIEAANRLAGERIPDLVELKYGWSMEEALIRLRAGLPLQAEAPASAVAPGWFGIKFLFPMLGTLRPPSSLRVVVENVPHSSALGERTFAMVRRTGHYIMQTTDREELVRYLALTEPAEVA